jgi:hypothetical protein
MPEQMRQYILIDPNIYVFGVYAKDDLQQTNMPLIALLTALRKSRGYY